MTAIMKVVHGIVLIIAVMKVGETYLMLAKYRLRVKLTLFTPRKK